MERPPWDTTPSTTSSDARTSADGSVLRTERPWLRPDLGQNRKGAYLGTRTRSRVILSMQLRGFTSRAIAEQLGLNESRVCQIISTKRYRAAIEAKLDEADDEFLRMKPLAMAAVRNGLVSRDESLGLRAAETWFKAHGYKGFGRQAETQVTVNITAEDVAVQLLNGSAARAAQVSYLGEGGEEPAGASGSQGRAERPEGPRSESAACLDLPSERRLGSKPEPGRDPEAGDQSG